MIDESEKYKSLVPIPEHATISYDLHMISIAYKNGGGNNVDRFAYMDKYQGEDSILDFYKPNSNILDSDDHE